MKKTKEALRVFDGSTLAPQTIGWPSSTVGWADLDTKVAATRTTVMRIGSTSKAVTATALAHLVDSGEMSLDAPLFE